MAYFKDGKEGVLVKETNAEYFRRMTKESEKKEKHWESVRNDPAQVEGLQRGQHQHEP